MAFSLSGLMGGISERRRVPRLRGRGNAYLRVDGRDVPLRDWSRIGFKSDPFEGLARGQVASLTIHIKDIQDPDGPLAIKVRARILRSDAQGMAGLWQAASPAEKAQLDRYAGRKITKARWRA
ncbi:MAG: hypothetical protein NXI16_14555 [Alphaproteobacteria bacterium]|nr:hypothetical protein [Alphaproteobacteria bacterium]